MVNILLLCASGMSTSLLVEKMKEVADDRHIAANVWAAPAKDIAVEAKKADIVLLGPQVLYMRDKIAFEIGRDIPVVMVPMREYGMMDGASVLDLAFEHLDKKH